MQYRKIGKTGVQTGVIGLGCEHLDRKPYAQVKETIDAALEAGITHLDVFMPGREVREHIAKALGNRRKDVTIQGHIGSTDIHHQYDISRDLTVVKRYFEEYLELFGYVDFGMMFFIDSEKDYQGVFETDFIRYVLERKQQGDIRHIGFSSHNPVMARKVIETGVPEMMLFSVNPAFDLHPAEIDVLERLNAQDKLDVSAFHGLDPVRADLYKLCEQRGIGITVMKTFGAGKLLSPEHTPFARPLTVAQCIHYALTRPAVAAVMLGCQSRQEVMQAMEYFDASDEERDYSAVLGTLKSEFRGHCVYCGHCQPCPSGIDIASVNKYLDIARLDETSVPPSIRSHYLQLEHHGSECIACRSCEKRCPFDVLIVENMRLARKIFEQHT